MIYTDPLGTQSDLTQKEQNLKMSIEGGISQPPETDERIRLLVDHKESHSSPTQEEKVPLMSIERGENHELRSKDISELDYTSSSSLENNEVNPSYVDSIVYNFSSAICYDVPLDSLTVETTSGASLNAALFVGEQVTFGAGSSWKLDDPFWSYRKHLDLSFTTYGGAVATLDAGIFKSYGITLRSNKPGLDEEITASLIGSASDFLSVGGEVEINMCTIEVSVDAGVGAGFMIGAGVTQQVKLHSPSVGELYDYIVYDKPIPWKFLPSLCRGESCDLYSIGQPDM